MDVALGALVVIAVAASAFAAGRLTSGPQRVLSPQREAMQVALHHASATLPQLRQGLTAESAGRAAPHLRALTHAAAVAIIDNERVLALEGTHSDDEEGLMVLARGVNDDRVHVEPRVTGGSDPSSRRAAVVAPLTVHDERIGTLVALYEPAGRLGPEDVRVVEEVAALVSAQIELAAVAEQGERLASAELRALRASISPHFIYNSLAAIASYIHSRPEEARELLTEFAAFTRYAFRGERQYVTLADELHYVEKYLRLEQARFGERLRLRVRVAPEVLHAVVPVLSLQPLIENAVRHGVESRVGPAMVQILGIDLGVDVEMRVCDDGDGMDTAQIAAALRGDAGGIGVSNVDRRLRATFGDEYALQIDSAPGRGTTVVMTVPKFRAGVRAA
jgi:two-component system LytT family sensor kinase